MKPILLDLFCKAGGAARGYADAGFDVVGVDIEPQANYPFEFVQMDALDVLTELLDGAAISFGDRSLSFSDFAAVDASPPCQRYSKITKRHGQQNEHPDLVDAIRYYLKMTALPYIIENVAGAPLVDPVTLCGSMFGLGAVYEGEWRYLQRHRLFESNFPLLAPGGCNHGQSAIGIYGNPGGSSKRDGIRFPGAAEWRLAMRVDWMTAKEMAEAIPPIYTQHLGVQLMAAVAARGQVAA